MGYLSTSEWILLGSLIVSIISLSVLILVNTLQIIRSNEDRRFHRFHEVTQKLLDVGRTLKDHKPKDQALWDCDVLNQAEYVAYLINRKKIDFHLTVNYIGDALVSYFEGIILKRYKHKLNDDDYYKEFRKLYHRLKSRKIRQRE